MDELVNWLIDMNQYWKRKSWCNSSEVNFYSVVVFFTWCCAVWPHMLTIQIYSTTHPFTNVVLSNFNNHAVQTLESMWWMWSYIAMQAWKCVCMLQQEAAFVLQRIRVHIPARRLSLLCCTFMPVRCVLWCWCMPWRSTKALLCSQSFGRVSATSMFPLRNYRDRLTLSHNPLPAFFIQSVCLSRPAGMSVTCSCRWGQALMISCTCMCVCECLHVTFLGWS